jgi:hypothetical protein
MMRKAFAAAAVAIAIASPAHADPDTDKWFQDMWNRVGQFQLECFSTPHPEDRNRKRVWLDVQWKDAKIIRTDWKGYGDKTTTILNWEYGSW